MRLCLITLIFFIVYLVSYEFLRYRLRFDSFLAKLFYPIRCIELELYYRRLPGVMSGSWILTNEGKLILSIESNQQCKIESDIPSISNFDGTYYTIVSLYHIPAPPMWKRNKTFEINISHDKVNSFFSMQTKITCW
jgi:hypothetical protein